MRARLGLAGWHYPGWVGSFYAAGAPEGAWLDAYARVFPWVEVDATGYVAPSRERVRAWAERAPEGFSFSPKLPRDVLDAVARGEAAGPVSEFLALLAPLRVAGKLGPLLATFPPSFRGDLDHDALAAFLEAWPSGEALAVELRHASWWRAPTYSLLRRHGATLVWSVTEYGSTPPVLTTRRVYLRLVGDRALDAGDAKWRSLARDQGATTEAWARQVAQARADHEEEWIVLNNHYEGHAPASAVRVARAFGLPPPDLAAAARGERQRALGDFA